MQRTSGANAGQRDLHLHQLGCGEGVGQDPKGNRKTWHVQRQGKLCGQWKLCGQLKLFPEGGPWGDSQWRSISRGRAAFRPWYQRWLDNTYGGGR